MTRSAIVTGASGGIGGPIVQRLVASGFRVFATGTKSSALDDLAKRTGCVPLVVDIVDPDAVSRSFDGLDAEIVIHAAGVLGPQVLIHETSPDTVASLLNINVVGTLNVIRSVTPSMISRGNGTLILLGSICGTAPGSGPGVYSACKAALHSIAANLRYELNGSGVRISEILLGRVKTGIHDQLTGGDDFYEGYECVLPEDVAETVLHIINCPAAVDLSTIEMMPTRQVVGGSRFMKK